MTPSLFGLQFYDKSMNRFIGMLENRIMMGQKTFVVTANPEIVMHGQRDDGYMTILKSADYIVADGIGIIMACRLIRHAIPKRITGISLMYQMLKVADQKQFRAYFLGSSIEVMKKLLDRMNKEFASVDVAGYQTGYCFDPYTVAEEIKEKQPDIIFVALGVPKQEEWISTYFGSYKKGIFIGVGGSFDVLSGVVKRAPALIRSLQLEWLYRLLIRSNKKNTVFNLMTFIKLTFQEFKKSLKR
ncbi:WecB/TagA/CpsF family glycosyltransferase [Tuberibacillus sp. Marseille-P3662]|uniref:WecB/TagA/CpsF family glycosyltransferase n=1 Tax=Tuberibacillus sp. Marseille-P3662 TaxID=1965358 RepID=UPI000A1CB891|nr:WecB/TagA/CpsF family glycosyltransferase [Tuberibacillus sp. Marseille-P3662]